ncbi:MAG: Phosphoribosylglycinamide formyltransferase [Microgenomates group bacterium GW2011_GWC1_41_8]|uniref:phosphoribosylglycinamide formyltransferase 1 n=2 Tax=Candidatus Roizmaniibacteriota TaxID=1752723 RepID=A0A0G0W8J5_9BACT|nr:MAG: Phosphoribosylglycinamide formyltransferase [Candidatus Roizmanbacteria bacterium GW2011_GWB1_40_7]KKR94218.1 MAG: Phosphoribosylglycinamide formyltransferase [Candidatus Roizmanbacteria bacterium GW2011_GWA1_41_13]KKS24750.1 MAG: Phosphoribosylglycinamide formyltransferase [Microgenomates group bacterium GW2011_GWC1_41_8]OGK48484.1 MAG: hypothetical protein A3A55_04655 [Candidatus Roizmanbacteria bacterium RIFCSPLOWO2_01_FULL_40_14]
MYRLSFLSSGTGAITRTVLEAIQQKALPAITPVSIISDRKSASLNLAGEFQITGHMLAYHQYSGHNHFSEAILDIFQKEKIDVILSTFDRILTGKLLKSYKYKMINVHPSLLPAFPGYGGAKKARLYGCRYIGATCHFIEEGTDTGVIINQGIVPVDAKGDVRNLEQKLYRVRQRLVLEALLAFCSNRIRVKNRIVTIDGALYNHPFVNPHLPDIRINRFLSSYEK